MDLLWTVISDVVVLSPFLLLENRVWNLFLSICHELMDLGGKLLNHLSVVPLRHVQKKRHLAMSQWPKKLILPSNRFIKSNGSVVSSNWSIKGIFRCLSIFEFSMSSYNELLPGTSRPPACALMKSLHAAKSFCNFTRSISLRLLETSSLKSSSSVQPSPDLLPL